MFRRKDHIDASSSDDSQDWYFDPLVMSPGEKRTSNSLSVSHVFSVQCDVLDTGGWRPASNSSKQAEGGTPSNDWRSASAAAGGGEDRNGTSNSHPRPQAPHHIQGDVFSTACWPWINFFSPTFFTFSPQNALFFATTDFLPSFSQWRWQNQEKSS